MIDQKMKTHGMLNLKKICPDLVIHMPYATTQNFIQTQVYPDHHAYLVEDAAMALFGVTQTLKKRNFRLLLWDAYRPFSVQEVFWRHVPDERYLSKPERNGQQMVSGSHHSRGAAVDVSLLDDQGNYISMPSDFDDFSEKAHSHLPHASSEEKKNVLLLRELMLDHGFLGIKYEWWHYNWHQAESLPLIDASFLSPSNAC